MLSDHRRWRIGVAGTEIYSPLQSAKTNLNVEQVFFSIARDIKQRLADTDSRAEVNKFLPYLEHK
jgi:hypothetical protein